MSQNDLSIANQGFASFRSDLNSALQALGSTNSGTSAPSTTYANQLFYDTTNNILKIRNEDNDAFISLFTLDQANDNIESLTINGALSAESLDLNGGELILDADNDTSITSDTDDRVDIKVAGSDVVHVTSTGLGVGTNSPSVLLDLESTDPKIRLTDSDATGTPECEISAGGGDLILKADRDGEKSSSIIGFEVDGSEHMRVVSSGALLLGSTSVTAVPTATTARNPQVEIVGSLSGSFHHGSLSLRCTNDGSVLYLSSALTSGDRTAGSLCFLLNDGTDYHTAGKIECQNDATTGNNDTPGRLTFSTTADGASSPTERMRIDSSGNLLVSTTTTSGFQSSSSESGSIIYGAGGIASNSASNDVPAVFNRLGNHGNIVLCKKDGTSVGAIATDSSIFKFYGVFSGGAGLGIYSNRSVRPLDSSGDASDNDCDLGHSSQRYATLFAGTGSINTSDKNEKQDVEVFSDAEMKVAKKISSLFKKFKYKDAVIAKGDDARVHSGVIAQEIENAFQEEKLDASNYAFWCKDTWKNDDGKEQTRYGIRYSELLSFICAYNEQRFASIEARITALEAK